MGNQWKTALCARAWDGIRMGSVIVQGESAGSDGQGNTSAAMTRLHLFL